MNLEGNKILNSHYTGYTKLNKNWGKAMEQDMWEINRLFFGILIGIIFVALICSIYKKIKDK